MNDGGQREEQMDKVKVIEKPSIGMASLLNRGLLRKMMRKY